MPARMACWSLLFMTLSVSACPAAPVDQTAGPIDPVLQASISEYRDTPDAERADQLFAEILGRRDATPAAVSAILAAGRSYRTEPVGALPSRELRLAERVFSYGLYVPDSYRPDKPYGLVICLHGAGDRKSTRLNSSHRRLSRMPSS